MDETRKLYEVVFEAVAVTETDVLGADGDAAGALHSALEVGTVSLCAEMVGGMQWVLDTTVEYAKTRQQFGRSIGSFQAVQHQCADMLLMTESARSAAYYAAWALNEERPVCECSRFDRQSLLLGCLSRSCQPRCAGPWRNRFYLGTRSAALLQA